MRILFGFRFTLVLLLAMIEMTLLSGLLLGCPVQFADGELYKYGFQLSYELNNQHWTYGKTLLGLLWPGTATTVFSFLLIFVCAGKDRAQPFRGTRTSYRLKANKLIPIIMFSAGALALTLSMNFNSPTLAFIGLGLVFWGTILFLVRPEKYVKEVLLDVTTLPSLANLNRMIREIDCKGRAVYLPPKCFKKFESTRVYISMEQGERLPTCDEIPKEENQVFLKNPEGVLIVPPGAELANLFEKKLSTSFAEGGLKYLEQVLPKLLIEDLEMAQNVEIVTENARIQIKIQDGIYKSICREVGKLANIHGSIGCPFCSSIACALAKATGNPIAIEKEEQSGDGKSMEIEFRLLGG